jgi:hypothetical protein
MGGMRELHAQDPETWTAGALAQKFGISYEAVKRILRSNWAATTTDKDVGKWSRAADGVNSPVPHIRAVYELKRADEAAARAGKPEGKSEGRKEPAKATGKGTGRGGKDKVGNGGTGRWANDKVGNAGNKWAKDKVANTRGGRKGARPPPLRQRGGFGIKE